MIQKIAVGEMYITDCNDYIVSDMILEINRILVPRRLRIEDPLHTCTMGEQMGFSAYVSSLADAQDRHGILAKKPGRPWVLVVDTGPADDPTLRDELEAAGLYPHSLK